MDPQTIATICSFISVGIAAVGFVMRTMRTCTDRVIKKLDEIEDKLEEHLVEDAKIHERHELQIEQINLSLRAKLSGRAGHLA